MAKFSGVFGALAVAAAVVSAPASAATTVVTTGASGGSGGDWTVTYTPPGSVVGGMDTTAPAVAEVAGGPIAALPGASLLRGAPAGQAAAGTYVFTHVFNLSNIGNVQSVILKWLADNQLFKVTVNNQTLFEVGTQNKAPDTTVQSLTFNNLIGSPFVNGSNTMEWYVWNRPTSNNNVTLRAAATVTAVPEPGTWLLMIFGLGAVGFAMRRRQQVATVRYQFA